MNANAIKKLNQLIARDDFEQILFVDSCCITIKFNDKQCELDHFGRVEWF